MRHSRGIWAGLVAAALLCAAAQPAGASQDTGPPEVRAPIATACEQLRSFDLAELRSGDMVMVAVSTRQLRPAELEEPAGHPLPPDSPGFRSIPSEVARLPDEPERSRW